jgi:ribose 5-phosphate isomerase A
MEPLSPQDRAKRAAGDQAITTYLKNGMKIGLGSGSTSQRFVRILGERVKAGLTVIGVPTSNATRDLAREVGVPLADLDDVGELDLAIDGADEIDAKGRMIKGGGANLLWEKIVACASRKMVALVDESKVVTKLGKFPLPIEVIPFGWRTTQRHLRELFQEFGWSDVQIKIRGGLEKPLLTDSGHYLLDCHLNEIADADAIGLRFNQIPGVVEHGLFIGIAKEAVIGHADESAEVVVFK